MSDFGTNLGSAPSNFGAGIGHALGRAFNLYPTQQAKTAAMLQQLQLLHMMQQQRQQQLYQQQEIGLRQQEIGLRQHEADNQNSWHMDQIKDQQLRERDINDWRKSEESRRQDKDRADWYAKAGVQGKMENGNWVPNPMYGHPFPSDWQGSPGLEAAGAQMQQPQQPQQPSFQGLGAEFLPGHNMPVDIQGPPMPTGFPSNGLFNIPQGGSLELGVPGGQPTVGAGVGVTPGATPGLPPGFVPRATINPQSAKPQSPFMQQHLGTEDWMRAAQLYAGILGSTNISKQDPSFTGTLSNFVNHAQSPVGLPGGQMGQGGSNAIPFADWLKNHDMPYSP